MSEKLEESFNKSVDDFKRQAFCSVIKQKPNSSIEELYALAKKYDLADLSMAEILSDDQKKAPKKRKASQKGVDVRTREGREKYDESVLQVIKNADGEYVSARSVRTSVGGTPLQVRKALARLVDRGEISSSGNARATRYAEAEVNGE